KSNPQGDRVLRSNSRGKKLEVEEHRRNVKLSKNTTSVTACNDSLNAKTVNVKSVSAMCAKCLIEIVLFIVDSGCSKHMTGNLKLLINFVEKFLGMIKLHLFLDMEIWKSTCFIRNLKGNDLLTGSRGSNLYSITLQESNSPNPICLMAKATSS
nr:hypothetical protein [Tanacetum cinerariifolium]